MLLQAVRASERVFSLLDRQPQMVPGGNSRPHGSPQGAHLEFRDVTFAYPSRPDIQVSLYPNAPHSANVSLAVTGRGYCTADECSPRLKQPMLSSCNLFGRLLRDLQFLLVHCSTVCCRCRCTTGLTAAQPVGENRTANRCLLQVS